MASTKATILLLGGTGKVASRIVPLLSAAGYATIVASRSGNWPSIPHTTGVVFEWNNSATYTTPFLAAPISAIFLVGPPILNMYKPMKNFIELAKENGVKRFVLLSASALEITDGPAMSPVSKYLSEAGGEWAVLRPSWFMENLSEQQHLGTILYSSQIITATGDGRLPFISVSDIAAVAFHALTDPVSLNTDLILLGPENLSYDDVAALLSDKIGRKIEHVKVKEEELVHRMKSVGIPEEYAEMLAQMDTTIREGKEERTNTIVEDLLGKKPKSLEEFVNECVGRGVWEKR